MKPPVVPEKNAVGERKLPPRAAEPPDIPRTEKAAKRGNNPIGLAHVHRQVIYLPAMTETRQPAECGICGRELVPESEAYGATDPRIDCGGDCMACMWSIEEDAGDERPTKPDNFQSGMNGRTWEPPGEAP